MLKLSNQDCECFVLSVHNCSIFKSISNGKEPGFAVSIQQIACSFQNTKVDSIAPIAETLKGLSETVAAVKNE